jgi:hypothetical protein
LLLRPSPLRLPFTLDSTQLGLTFAFDSTQLSLTLSLDTTFLGLTSFRFGCFTKRTRNKSAVAVRNASPSFDFNLSIAGIFDTS